MKQLSVGLLLVTAALLLASPTGARVVPGQSISGIAIDMSRETVERRLGKPTSKRRVRTGAWGPGVLYRYGWLRLRVLFTSNDRVRKLRTTNRSERTPRGLRVGASKRTVRARLRGERCGRDRHGEWCFTGADHPTHTVFRMQDDRLVAIVVRSVLGTE